MSMGVGVTGVGDEQRIAHAFAQVRADPSLQFAFPASEAFNARPPGWLLALIKGIVAIWPFLQAMIWVVIAGVAIAGGVYLALHLNERRRRPKPARPAPEASALPAWRPSEHQARALLAEADAMAAAGRFEDAAHLLLLRSIEDIRQRRPAAVRPALTSRDIAGLEALPPAARSAFAAIAEVVEASWFGGRAVDAPGFAHCRRVYEAFALPTAWTAA
jgi:Domain of unknown function (DUF4129)